MGPWSRNSAVSCIVSNYLHDTALIVPSPPAFYPVVEVVVVVRVVEVVVVVVVLFDESDCHFLNALCE